MPEELQKDPVSRGEFLWMGAQGALIGAVLTIPPTIYILDPVIKSEYKKQSDVPDRWQALGSVFKVPAHRPEEYRIEFPQIQSYALEKEKIKESGKEGSIVEVALVSWKEGEIPSILENRGDERLSASEIEELTPNLNVMSNHCTHLGCPVRWLKDKGLMLCPCHGGEYDINGDYAAGPPPRGLYRYTFEIRENGGIYVKHEFDGNPYVI